MSMKENCSSLQGHLLFSKTIEVLLVHLSSFPWALTAVHTRASFRTKVTWGKTSPKFVQTLLLTLVAKLKL